ncbi:hypothetical protein DFJ74DRAFT_767621 [Hyaloraphidium curvatum]|nr:hypothetical protein DFJ74DRAFT_767621 [Hyaloraphidium curvatum]
MSASGHAHGGLQKPCGHGPCSLTQPSCCPCLDRREVLRSASEAALPPDVRKRGSYLKYVDGHGFLPVAAREEWYCGACKDRLGFVPDVPTASYVPLDPETIPGQSPITQMFIRSFLAQRNRDEEDLSDPARLWNPHANLPVEIPYKEWFCPHSPEWTDCRACMPDDAELAAAERKEAEIVALLVQLGTGEDEAGKIVRLAGVLRRRREEERRLRYWRARRDRRPEGGDGDDGNGAGSWLDEWTPESIVSWIVGAAGREREPVVRAEEPAAGGADRLEEEEGEPREKGEGERASKDCRICFSRSVDAVIIPCGHLSVCMPCASRLAPSRRQPGPRPDHRGRRLRETEARMHGQPHAEAYWEEEAAEEGVRSCPICRTEVERIVQVFRA